jgi:hypothetical protein
MKIKATLISDRVLELTVSEQSEPAVEELLQTGVPPKEWILGAAANGWPCRLNLGLCVAVEKATS